MDYGALIGMVAQLAGSAAGQAASQMDRDTAMRLIQAAVDDMGKINVPKLQQLLLEKQGATGLAGIKDDPTYRGQQQAADAQLNDIIGSGGLTLADKAALNAIRNRVASDDSSRRASIENDLAARGQSNSGTKLASQLASQQQASNIEAAAGESAAGQAQARALAAIRERGRMAGEGLDRDYRQKSDAARAQDAINAGNVAIANTALRYNAGIPQQDFNNQLSLAQAKAGATRTLSDAYKGQATDTRNTWNGVGRIAAEGARAIGSGPNSGDSNDYASRGGASDISGGHADQELVGEPTRPQSDGSENYEVDPATGRIRRKLAQQGQNF